MSVAGKPHDGYSWNDYRSWDNGERWELHSPSFPELALDLAVAFTLPVPIDEQIDEIRESAPPYDTRSADA